MNKDKSFHRFVKLSDTRWLAHYNVVRVIDEHYEELSIHFAAVVKQEKCYKARELHQILMDKSPTICTKK